MDGLASGKIKDAREALGRAEKASGAARNDELSKLAASLDADEKGAGDPAKVGVLAGVVKMLGKETM
jgi:hypothetical protein